MPQEQDTLYSVDPRAFIDNLNDSLRKDDFKPTIGQRVLSLDDLRKDESNRATASSAEREKGAPRGTFGSQFIWGAAESAMVAPSLWEYMGGMQQGSIKESILDESERGLKLYGAKPGEEMTGMAKFGYIAGAGAGMLIPFSAAGKIVKGAGWAGAKVLGGGIQLFGGTGALTRRASKELITRAGMIEGKGAIALSDDVAKQVITTAKEVIGRKGRAKAVGVRRGTEDFNRVAQVEMKERLTQIAGVSDDIADDVSRLAIDSAQYHTAGNTHALLESTFGKIPGVGGDLASSYMYDALLGATFGFGSALAHDYANKAWKADPTGEGSFSVNDFGRDAAWNDYAKEALTHGVALGFLGPVRHLGSATSRPLLTVPRPWNGQGKGKVNMVVGGIMRALKPTSKMKPREMRATLKLISNSSENSLHYYNIKALKPYIGKTNWWETVPEKELAGVMNAVRLTFAKKAPWLLAKETGEELVKSLPRMAMGAFAMNISSVYDTWNSTYGANTYDRLRWTAGSSFGEGPADIFANILVGAIMTRQGRAFRRQSTTGSKKWYNFNRGTMPEYLEGKSGYLQEITQGMQKFGLSPKTRHALSMAYFRDSETPEKYGDSLIVNMTEAHPDYRKLNSIIDEHLLDPKSKLPTLDTGKKDFESAIDKALESLDYSTAEKAEIRDSYSIAMEIINHVDSFKSGDAVLKEMTPTEAVEFVRALANTPITGKKATTKGENSIGRLLKELRAEATMNGVNASHNNIVSWWTNMADVLGIKYEQAPDGRIFVENSVRLPWASKDVSGLSSTEQQKQNIKITFGEVTEKGESNGWIVPQNITGTSVYRATSADWKKAADVQREHVDAHHRLVYGANSTREARKEAANQDELILTHDVWHIAYREGKKWTQGENVQNFMEGKFDKVATNQDASELEEMSKKIDQVFGTNKVELNKDSNKGKLTSDEVEALSQFVNNFGKIYSLGQQQASASGKTRSIDIAEAVEIKDSVESSFGDAFRNSNTVKYIEDKMIERAVSKLDIPGASREIKRAILSLSRNRDFTDQIGTLRTVRSIRSFLDMMERSYGKDADEVKMLKEFYDEIGIAVGQTDSQMIKMREVTMVEGKEDAIYSALRVANEASRRENYISGIEDTSIMVQEGNTVIKRAAEIANQYVDEDTGKIIDEELFQMWKTTEGSVKSLTEQITLALYEGNSAAIKSIRKLKPDYLDLLKLMENSDPKTPHKDYQTHLARLTGEIREINLGKDRTEVENLIEADVTNKGVVDIKSPIEQENKITPQRFIAKYMYSIEKYQNLEKALIEKLQTGNSGVKILEEAAKTIRDSYEALGIKETDSAYPKAALDKIMKDRDYLVQRSKGKPLTEKEMVDMFFDNMKFEIEANIDRKIGEGSINESERPQLMSDLNTDLYQILTNAFTNRIVRTLEYNRGAWELSKISVPETEKGGFVSLENYAPGLQGNIFIMSNSAIDNIGRKHNQIGADVYAEIEAALKGTMRINSMEAKKDFFSKADLETLEKNKDAIIGLGDEFALMRMDEGTDIVIKLNDATVGAIENAFRFKDSEFRKDLEGAVDMENKTVKKKLDDIFDLGKARGEKIKEALKIMRAVADSPDKVEQYLKGQLDDADLKAEWKRLKMYQPKSGFTGSEQNVKFVYELYKKLSKVSEKHENAYWAIKKVFGEKGELPFKILTIDDEGTPAGRGFNPFSHSESAAQRYDKMRSNQDITEEQMRAMQDIVEKDPKSNVDGMTYVSKEAFEALMAFLGVKDSMIEYHSDGTMTIRAGALKPIFAHNEINRESGEIKSFLLKTSIQYNPELDGLFIDKPIHGITFKSAAKKHTRKSGRGEVPEDMYMPVTAAEGDALVATTMDKIKNNVSSNFGDGRHVAEIPLESINIRQASREHDAVFSANTTVHWGAMGMKGASDWTQIDSKMKVFEQRMNELWSNPIRATAIAREVLGYSQEIGDQYLVNTGLDYIIQNEGLMASEWMIPILERSVISSYLNGGNISASRIRDGSSDVMTAENGDLQLPVRRMIDGRPRQEVFGGGRVSQFSADKPLKIHGRESVSRSPNGLTENFNSNTNDTHALIVRVARGQEGVFVDGADGVTFYVDGFQIRKDVSRREPVYRVYDMSKSMEKEIERNTPIHDSMAAHYETAVEEIGRTKHLLETPELSVNDYIRDLKGLDGDQRVWMAGLKSRQPRNQAGDFIIEKIEGVAKGAGNVSETNSVDALTILDADFDFDKSSNYLSAPEAIWGESARMAGYTVMSTSKDIHNKITEQFAAFKDEFEHKGNIIETSIVRARFVKMHQIMTYLNNMFGENQIMNFKIGHDGYEIKLKRSESNYLNTSDQITKYVKAFIDVYKETPGAWNNKEFIQKSMRDIWFGEDGMFKILKTTGNEFEVGREIDTGGQGINGTVHREIVEAIEHNFIRPIGQYVQLNRGQDIDGGGYSKHAGLQEFSAAVDKLGFAFHKDKQNNYGDKSALKIHLESGLTSANDYFRKFSRNPFDEGMRRLHNLNQNKFRDVDPYRSDVGEIIRLIEEGLVDDTNYQQNYNFSVNQAFRAYVKNEMRAADVVDIRRRLDYVENKIQDLQLRYKPELVEDYAEMKDLRTQQVRLAEAVTDLQQMMGAGRDWKNVQGEKWFEKAAYPFKGKEVSYLGKGEWTNNTGDPVVVISKANKILEVIPKDKSNSMVISKSHKFHRHGRRYKYSGEDQTGAYINHEAFSGTPTIYDKGAEQYTMDSKAYKRYDILVQELDATIKDIDLRMLPNHQGRQKLFLHPREHSLVGTERKAALHYLVVDKLSNVGGEGNLNLIRKYALFHKMMTPELTKNIILSYPVTGTNVQKLAHKEMVRMKDFGRREQLAWEYLKDIANNISYTDGPITPREAKLMLDNMMYQQKVGYMKITHPLGDYRLAMDGMAAADINVSKHWLFQDKYLNQSIYDKFAILDGASKEAASVLIGYASGEGGMVDPMTLYRMSERMSHEGIPMNETFMNEGKYYDGKRRTFGNFTEQKQVTYWDTPSNKSRRFGSDGIVKESPVDQWKRISECLR